jgi:hypothetical protein
LEKWRGRGQGSRGGGILTIGRCGCLLKSLKMYRP